MVYDDYNSDVSSNKWSRKNECCIECGTTEIPHWARGLCEKCYPKSKWYKESAAKYRKSPKGKARDDRYNNGPARKIRDAEYYTSDHYKETRSRYANSPEGKAAHRKAIAKFNKTLKFKANQSRYQATSKGRESLRRNCRTRRARKLNLNAWIPFYNLMWNWALDLVGGSCPKCGKNVGREKLTMDHIIPLSRSGIHSIANVMPLCFSCNCRKNAT